MNKVLDWLKMRSTQLGFASVLIVVLEQFRPEFVSVTVAVLAGMGFILPDRKIK